MDLHHLPSTFFSPMGIFEDTGPLPDPITESPRSLLQASLSFVSLSKALPLRSRRQPPSPHSPCRLPVYRSFPESPGSMAPCAAHHHQSEFSLTQFSHQVPKKNFACLRSVSLSRPRPQRLPPLRRSGQLHHGPSPGGSWVAAKLLVETRKWGADKGSLAVTLALSRGGPGANRKYLCLVLPPLALVLPSALVVP